MTLRERIVCALSPESLRKRVDNQQAMTIESSPKKKKSSFSPGTSPSNTSQLVKRSKIEDEQQKQPESSIPLSPSINFIDASMTESFESTSKLPTSKLMILDKLSGSHVILEQTLQILENLKILELPLII